ncbi:MAG: SDR family oxidoreductase [Pseudonocardiaceae bacterium]|nr:MAG: SDR family oxidoreductase [Pseudonocardiaceae bacterium]
MTTYAVTGATGKLGTLVVDSLLARGVSAGDVVALVRDTAKAAGLAERGVQVRTGDYDDPAGLPAALAGVDRLLLVSSPTVGSRVAQHVAVIDAAADAGVSRIVYTSVANADTTTMPVAPDHLDTEAHLAKSGIPTVVLRNGWYVENYTDQLPQYRRAGALISAAGDGRIAAAPRTDYADAAAAALVGDVDTAVYELGGPAFTLRELAAALSEITGEELPFREVTLDEYRAGLLAAGLDEGTAGFVTALEAGTARGDLDLAPTALEELIGRPATGLRPALATILG